MNINRQGVIPCTQRQDLALSAGIDTCTTTHSTRSTSQNLSTPSKGSDTLLRAQSIRWTDGHLGMRNKAVKGSRRQTMSAYVSSDLLYTMMPPPQCEKRTPMYRTIALALFAFHGFNIKSESQVLHSIDGLSSAYDTQPTWFLFNHGTTCIQGCGLSSPSNHLSKHFIVYSGQTVNGHY